MLTTWELLWALRAEDWLRLADWHLWLVLGVLALFAVIGVQWMVGDGLRLAWRGPRQAGQRIRWVTPLTAPVILLSVAVWLGSYLMLTGAPRLIAGLLGTNGSSSAALAEQLGEALLAPAWGPDTAMGPSTPGTPPSTLLDPQSPHQPPGPQGSQALPPPSGPADGPSPPAENQPAENTAPNPPLAETQPPGSTHPDGDLRPPAKTETPAGETQPPANDNLPTQQDAKPAANPNLLSWKTVAERIRAESPDLLREVLNPERVLSNSGRAAPLAAGGPRELALAMADNWLTDPDQNWPDWEIPGLLPDPHAESDDPLQPAEFLLSLVRELDAASALPQTDWAYVAGLRFQQRVLTPLVSGYLQGAAVTTATLMLVLDGLFFWGVLRLRKGRRSSVKLPKKPAASTPSSTKTDSVIAPVEGTSPASSSEDASSLGNKATPKAK